MRVPGGIKADLCISLLFPGITKRRNLSGQGYWQPSFRRGPANTSRKEVVSMTSLRA